MKKVLIVMICLLMCGCGNTSKDISNQENDYTNKFIFNTDWRGEYVNDDGVILSIGHLDNENKSALSFTIELGVKGFGNCAYLISGTNRAIYDAKDNEHTLEFTFEKDRVIVQESGGLSYLNTQLSGEYRKK